MAKQYIKIKTHMKGERKMKKERLAIINQIAWTIRKEAAQKWNCKISAISWKHCIQFAIEELDRQDKETPITFDQWFSFFQEKEPSFDYILYQKHILTKNRKVTESQEWENDHTTASYKILFEEEEDIRQLALQKVLEYFSRKGTIKKAHIFTIWSIACQNAIIQVARQQQRFHTYSTQQGVLQIGYDSTGQTIVIDDDSSRINLLKLDLEKHLDTDDIRIISMLEQGYQKQEIAQALGISRMGLYNREKKLRAKILALNLVSQRVTV